MNDIIVKVAPNGEGKTSWLIEQAKKEHDENGKTVVFFSASVDANRYVKFVEKYYAEFKTTCPVMFANRIDGVPDGAVVLVDNLFKQDVNVFNFASIFGRGCRCYATVCGIAAE